METWQRVELPAGLDTLASSSASSSASAAAAAAAASSVTSATTPLGYVCCEVELLEAELDVDSMQTVHVASNLREVMQLRRALAASDTDENNNSNARTAHDDDDDDDGIDTDMRSAINGHSRKR